MKFPLMWFIEYKPTDSYLPLSHRSWHSRSPSNWTSVKPAEQGTSIPRLFSSIKSAAGAMARYREGIHQNDYEDGIAAFEPYLKRKVMERHILICAELDRIAEKVLDGTGLPVYLVCFCSPKACHGDVIKNLILSAIAGNQGA